ncbi:hypothetical protein ZWY2020_022728 [Hordeum vulgare]|nr:hypothetical protein ZWY2020_022728 [Hordeum vulgare]
MDAAHAPRLTPAPPATPPGPRTLPTPPSPHTKKPAVIATRTQQQPKRGRHPLPPSSPLSFFLSSFFSFLFLPLFLSLLPLEQIVRHASITCVLLLSVPFPCAPPRPPPRARRRLAVPDSAGTARTSAPRRPRRALDRFPRKWQEMQGRRGMRLVVSGPRRILFLRTAGRQ